MTAKTLLQMAGADLSPPKFSDATLASRKAVFSGSNNPPGRALC